MKFQVGDYVLWDGSVCRVTYANDEIVNFRRISDAYLMARSPRELAAEQVPWINTGKGWWSQMRDVAVVQLPFFLNRPHRLRGEWFNPAPEIHAYIDEIKRQG